VHLAFDFRIERDIRVHTSHRSPEVVGESVTRTYIDWQDRHLPVLRHLDNGFRPVTIYDLAQPPVAAFGRKNDYGLFR
jgi:hypothetical protein